MRLLNIYRKDARNAGDLKSSPFLYFSFNADRESVDILKAGEISDLSSYDAVIIGGGGLLEEKWFMPILVDIRRNCHAKTIIWGTGLNHHFYEETICFAPSLAVRYRQLWDRLSKGRIFGRRLPAPKKIDSSRHNAWLKTCDLVGVRDYGLPFDWVPCASCMVARLDDYRNITPTHPLIAIDHPDFCKIELSGIPCFSNLGNDFDGILSFIASGETVLCASYHAAYWAILMGRKVIVVPWSEKFQRLKYSVPECLNRRKLKGCIRRAIAYPEALAECRERNRDFASKVANLLGLQWNQLPAQESGNF